MEIKTYNVLPEEAKTIRVTVFCKEQGFLLEFDEADERSTHLVAYEDNTPVATCRYYPLEQAGHFLIGRIAVLRSHRGRGLGGMLVREAEAEIKKLGGVHIRIGAQVQALPFYEKLGYTPVGARYMDEHVPHQRMEKEI